MQWAEKAQSRGKRIMPLRVRLIALIGSVLLVSLACGSVLVAWRAAHSVRTELCASKLDVGTKTIHNGLDELVASGDRANELRRLVATFNGNRHVRAALLLGCAGPSLSPCPACWYPDGPGARLVPCPGSAPSSARFLRLRFPSTAATAASSSCRSIRSTRSARSGRNRVTRSWCSPDSRCWSALLTCAVVGRALRPIEDLSNKAFQRIGKGNYYGRVSENGPPELTWPGERLQSDDPAACRGGGAEPPVARASADVTGGRARRSRTRPA